MRGAVTIAGKEGRYGGASAAGAGAGRGKEKDPGFFAAL
jgi:hypothetical protein